MSDKIGEFGELLQAAYEAKRRAWAQEIGRPYPEPEPDPPATDSEPG